MSATAKVDSRLASSTVKRNNGRAYLIVTVAALFWLIPIVWTIYTSLRPYGSTAKRGYVSIGGPYNFGNYTKAWRSSGLLKYFWNTMIVVIPAVFFTLLLASMIAFVVSRLNLRFNLLLLLLFTAGNLMPQQIIITPLFQIYKRLWLPNFMSNGSGHFFNSLFGIICIHVAFQVGFCTFVLSNFMKAFPAELNEAARIDGAGVWRQYWQVIMPLTRPAMAALATLQFTWIYNDYLWARILIQKGNLRPITSALENLKGVYFQDNNLIAAGSMLAAIPTLAVYFALQKQFISGLTLGASKG
jgi:multiple sugar transport system permease protein